MFPYNVPFWVDGQNLSVYFQMCAAVSDRLTQNRVGTIGTVNYSSFTANQ